MSKLNNDKVSVELDLKASKAEEEIHRLTKATEALRKQNTEHRKEISRLAATEGDHSAEIKRLNEVIRNNTREIENNKRSITAEEKKIDITRKSAAQLGRELKNLKRELANTSKATHPEKYRDLEKQIRQVEKANADATKTSQGFLTSLLSLDKMSAALKGVFMGLGMVITTYIINTLKSVKDTIVDFEKANSKLAAVLGTSFDGVSKLTDQAKELGRTTTATASEVTGLQIELAKLGFSQDVIEKMTPATLKFAKAVDTDLSSAAAFAGAALRMFNKDASEAENVMATFAIATTNSALDFSKLESSLATVGPVANAFGFSIEDTTALLGHLANAGFDASSAATATRNILLKLCDANGNLAQALGGPVTNLDELVAGLNKLSAEGINLAGALELTDKRSVAAFSTFLNGSGSMIELRDNITDCTGAFNQMSDTMTDNAAGSAAAFGSAVEGLILKFFDWREAIKTLYEWGTALVNWIGDFIDAFQPAIDVLETMASVIGQVISAIGTFVGWLTNLFTQTARGRAVLNGVVAALVTYKVATLLASKATLNFGKSILGALKSLGLFLKNIILNTANLVKESAATIAAAISTRTFNAALMANPLILILSLIAMAIAAFMGYSSATKDATDAQRELNEVEELAAKNKEDRIKREEEMNATLAVERDRITQLLAIAENENISKERREKAIKRLNEICPEYNGYIDQETGALKGATQALYDYLNALEKKAKMEYYKDTYVQYVKDIEAGQHKIQQLYNKNLKDEVRRRAELVKKMHPELDDQEAREKAYNQMYAEWANGNYYNNDALNNAFDEMNQASSALHGLKAEYYDFRIEMNQAGIDLEEIMTQQVVEPLKKTGGVASQTVSRLKEINAELKQLRKIDPQSDEELQRIQERIKLLQQERSLLLGKTKNKRTPGTYGIDSIDEVTAPVDDAHQRRLLEINKSDQTSAEKAIAKNRELIRYCSELNDALETLRSKTDSTHLKTLDAITAKQNELAQQAVTAQNEINKAQTSKDAAEHSERLKSLQVFYEHYNLIVRTEVKDQLVAEEAAEIDMMVREQQYHNDRLAELQRYYNQVSEADYMSTEEKNKLLKKIGADIRSEQSTILTGSAKFAEKLRGLMTDTTSAAGITSAYKQQRGDLIQTYDAMIAAAAGNNDQVVALEAEKNRRLAALDYEHQEQMFSLQELTGLSWSQEYDRELAKLENMHAQGLIDEKNYQKARLQLQVNNAKKYFDYYSQMAGSMFTALQDAEIAQSDAKYDVLIQQAKNNGEDTAALEEEKENKKLEIQKKYADVNFAIKISQIIADTAVSIMKAFADLGPIGGAISAAMLTATGVAQVIQAKAERDKIKNMSPSNTAGKATAPATAERVLSGYSEGGYTGDGDRYEVAGVVHRGEYVVPKPIMSNPRVVDAVGTIEAIRRNRAGGSAVPQIPQTAGYAEGGYTGDSVQVSMADLNELNATLQDLREGIKNIRAYIVFRDLDKAKDIMDRSRNPFTLNK